MQAKRNIVWLHTFLHSAFYVGDQLAYVISLLSSPFLYPYGKNPRYLWRNRLAGTQTFMDLLPVIKERLRCRPASSLFTIPVL
jgi:hypothetical protein